MILFLEQFFERTGSDDIAVLLGGMMLIDDEETMDPAMWNDWIKAVKEVKEEGNDPYN